MDAARSGHRLLRRRRHRVGLSIEPGRGGRRLDGRQSDGLTTPIFTTGDNVYPNGIYQEFVDFYDPSWGQFNSKIRPVPGNHDWGVGVTNSLAGYYQYFGVANTTAPPPAAPVPTRHLRVSQSFYSYDVDADWHVVNLDSECALVGGCNAGSPQHQWLVADLAANAAKNVIAIWHKPRFGSGATNLTALQPLVDELYAAGVDVTLAGHDHIYERLAPMDAGGNVGSDLRHAQLHRRHRWRVAPRCWFTHRHERGARRRDLWRDEVPPLSGQLQLGVHSDPRPNIHRFGLRCRSRCAAGPGCAGGPGSRIDGRLRDLRRSRQARPR